MSTFITQVNRIFEDLNIGKFKKWFERGHHDTHKSVFFERRQVKPTS